MKNLIASKCRYCGGILDMDYDPPRFCSTACRSAYGAERNRGKPMALGCNLYELIPDDKKHLVEKVYPYPWMKWGVVF